MATTTGQDGPPLTYEDPLNGKAARGVIRLPVVRQAPVVVESAPPVTVVAPGGIQLTGTQILIGVVILALLLKGK